MNKKIKVFTLAELMIVLVIIGILVLLALPNLMPLISKAKSTEAKIHLEHIYNLEKNYLYSSYSICTLKISLLKLCNYICICNIYGF